MCAQLYLTLYSPMDYSPPGSSVHGILQARVLEWGAISCSRGFCWPRCWTHVSHVSRVAGVFLTTVPPGKPQIYAFHKFYKPVKQQPNQQWQGWMMMMKKTNGSSQHFGWWTRDCMLLLIFPSVCLYDQGKPKEYSLQYIQANETFTKWTWNEIKIESKELRSTFSTTQLYGNRLVLPVWVMSSEYCSPVVFYTKAKKFVSAVRFIVTLSFLKPQTDST